MRGVPRSITYRASTGTLMTVITRIKEALPQGGSLTEPVWKRRHHAITAILWVHVPAVVVFAVVRGYPLAHGLIEATPVAAFAVIATQRRGSRAFRSSMSALGLLTATAVLVHLSGGVTEMHFHFFVVLGVLTMYQDWRPLLLAIAYVVFHHGVMGVLDPRSVYGTPAAWRHPWTWAAIHGGAILAASAAYVVAWRFNEDAQAEVAASYRQLQESEDRFRGAFENAPIGVALVDLRGRFLRVNEALCSMLGRMANELIGEEFAGITHPGDIVMTGTSLARLAAHDGGPARTEQRYVRTDGQIVWAQLSASEVADQEGNPLHIVCQIEDITDRKRAEQEIAFLAYHDKLTGLANRAMFEDLLEMALSRAQRHGSGVAVLFLDLDDFKLVNDSLGHVTGDQLLVQVADRLRQTMRLTDVVARQGGDEFLVLLSDFVARSGVPASMDSEGSYLRAESAAQRIQEALRDPFTVAGNELYVSASIGVSVFPTDATDATSLTKNADSAMYWSKQGGPGGYRIFVQAEGGSSTRLSLATKLRRAVEEQSWKLHYQPMVDLESGRMWGVEALVRWLTPDGGLIPPGEFIPLAEEMGLIGAVGDWVILEMCRQDAEWRSRGLELELAFNLSARQLRRQKLAERLLEPFEANGVDPRRVVIEITESAAMTDPERSQWILHECRERGFRVAIDDFGTGYSSLSRLRHLPVDILKIDLSFVHDVPGDPHANRMVGGIIQLAEGLDMVPLAEGVETEEQRRFLIDEGCTLGQGYLFSRPVPPDEIERIALRHEDLRVLRD